MPIPPINLPFTIGSDNCGPLTAKLTLNDITAVVLGADDTSLAAFQAAMLAKFGYQPVTLQAMIDASGVDDSPRKNEIAVRLGYPSIYYSEGLDAVLLAMGPETAQKTACDAVKIVAETGTVEGTVTVLTTQEIPSLVLKTNPETGCAILALTLTEALLQQAMTTIVDVLVDACGTTAPDQALILPTPVLKSGRFNQGQYLQSVLNQLGALLRCCPPCAELERELFFPFGAGEYTAAFNIGHVRITAVINEVAPRMTILAEPNVGLYGSFRWRFVDGSLGAVMMINSLDQYIHAEVDGVIGINYVLNYGVSVSAQVWERPFWHGYQHTAELPP